MARSRDGTGPNRDRAVGVLVVDDEPTLREVLTTRIAHWGYQTTAAADAGEARREVERQNPSIVISDIVLPDASGLELLRTLLADDDRRQIILITAHGTIDLAVEAMKAGARDFLTKPLDESKLRAALEAARDEVSLAGAARELESRLEDDPGLGRLVGASEPMRELFHLVELVAPSGTSVLITGESGTGKELVARTIHDLSRRAAGPFVAVNAAAIPEGLIESEIFGHDKGAFTGATSSRPGCFELADGGTLFFDEIAEMPPALQPKLLRILEERRARRLGGSREREFDVRVLAATNRDPAESVQAGKLREDLYYRLSVFSLVLPPLRERRGDIPLLAQYFVREFNQKHETEVRGLRARVRELLEGYRWTGNVRELRNVIERATVLARSGWIEASHLPPYLAREEGRDGIGPPTLALPIGITAAEAEKRLILKTLAHVGNNKAEAARRLGLDPKTIRNKLKAWEAEA